MNDADPCNPMASGDEVRNITFGKGQCDASQVKALLDRIATELDAGRPAAPVIENATLKNRLLPAGYDRGAVDWFLEQLWLRENPAEADRMNADPWRALAADPYCIRREPGHPAGQVAEPSPQACADAWEDFARQPGTRLSWVRTGAWRDELRTADQRAVVSHRLWPMPETLIAGGRTFTWKQLSRSSGWRRSKNSIRPAISREYPYATAHMRKRQAENQTGHNNPGTHQLLDETGTPVLYAGGMHTNGIAGGYIKFPGQRWLRFPVRGTWRSDGIMTAVDQEGNKVARYRLVRGQSRYWTTEITVHPGQRLTDELVLAIGASAPWLLLYFKQEGGGGG